MRLSLVFQALREFPRYSLRFLSRGRVIRDLLQSHDPRLNSLGTVLNRVKMRQYSARERGWIDRIEAFRQRLKTSKELVEVMDYGAGHPSLRPSAERMSQGRIVTRTEGEIRRTDAHPGRWSLVLFTLIRTFRPKVCLELGTGLGISAAYQESALRLNGNGNLVTLEGSRELARLAQSHLEEMGLDGRPPVVGRFEDTLPQVLRDHHPIDFVFIDGHHDGPATVSYVEQILPRQVPGSLVILDDISWSQEMKQAWRTIGNKREMAAAVDLFLTGMCVVDLPGGDEPRWVRTAV